MEEKMKKIRSATLLALIITSVLLLLLGCKKEDKITSVSLKDNDPNAAVEIAAGDFDYGDYTVIVAYKSGSTEEIALSEEMISAADQVKLFQAGDHEITVSYGDQKYTFKVSVKRTAFEGLSFSENNVFTYDGKAHSVEVEGNIPANAVVTYSGGNSFVNAGTYNVNATVSCDGYVTARLSTTVTIQRAKYDMSGVKLEGKEFVYDGNAHSLAISGTLPEGVLPPTYSINEKEAASATDAGEYTVRARFANNNPNYEAIPDMVATLRITPAEYNLKGFDIVFKKDDGKLIDGASKVYDGKSVIFDLNDYNKLSSKISVSFSVSDKSGRVISNSNKVTGIKNAGTYTVKAEFTLADGKNYKPIEPIVRTFTVEKAEYDMTDVHFDNDVSAYDGAEHRLLVDIPSKHPIDATDVTYEYYLDGELLVGTDKKPVQSVTEAGEYTVKAIFTVRDENYKQIEPMQAILVIEA